MNLFADLRRANIAVFKGYMRNRDKIRIAYKSYLKYDRFIYLLWFVLHDIISCYITFLRLKFYRKNTNFDLVCIFYSYIPYI